MRRGGDGLKGRICRIILGISAAVFTALVIALHSESELCIGAAVVVCVNFILTIMLKFGFGLAAESGYKNAAKLDRILSVSSIVLLILSVPLFLVPVFYESISDTAFAVYVNIIGAVLLISILIADKKK